MTEKFDSKERIIRSFDEIRVGDEAELTHYLTREDVKGFADLTGDFNPLHLDEDFASKSTFHKPIVHGMLSASFISTMIGMLLPGPGALWTSQTLNFQQPAYVGDTIRVKARVKQKSTGTRVVILDVTIINEKGQELVVGESTVKMLVLENQKGDVNMNTKKVVLITGGSRGIGAATSRKLASDGHNVVVNFANSQAEAEKLVNEINKDGGQAMAVKADIVEPSQVNAMFQEIEHRYGSVQSIVHCAAPASAFKLIEDLEWETIQRQLDVQLMGAFNCVKAAMSGMVSKNSGLLVFISSISTDIVPPTQQTDYVIAKSALEAMARCLAVEYSPKGVRVNVISPGMTQTDRIADLPEKARMLTRMQTPLRRLAEPEDIANVVAFLLGPGGRHISGETIRVCGGIVMI